MVYLYPLFYTLSLGTFLHVSAGTRTIEDKDEATSTSIIHCCCWGNRANVLLAHFEAKQSSVVRKITNTIELYCIGTRSRACAIAIKIYEDELSLDSNVHPLLECCWTAVSDFDAHQVPVGIQIVA